MTQHIDPDAAALEGTGVFGLPDEPERARVHILPVPFDATTSYRKGACDGPEAARRVKEKARAGEERLAFWEEVRRYE